MRLVLGVDGGQTSTVAALMDEDGTVLGRGVGGPANHIHEPGGVERVQRSVRDAVEGARRSAGLPDAPIACAFLGMTGLAPDMEAICRPSVPAERLLFGHDTRVALYSVTLGEPGVVVIAGTGSVAYGRSPSGHEASVGGWGYLMGDEGSAYRIGVEALRHCARAADGLAEPTGMLPFVLTAAGCTSLREVHRRVYGRELDRPAIAGFARCAGLAADRGDAAARRILREAGESLGAQASAVIDRLQLGADPVTVGTVGGVFRAGDWVLQPMADALHSRHSHASLASPRHSLEVAAGLLALESLGVRPGANGPTE